MGEFCVCVLLPAKLYLVESCQEAGTPLIIRDALMFTCLDVHIPQCSHAWCLDVHMPGAIVLAAMVAAGESWGSVCERVLGVPPLPLWRAALQPPFGGRAKEVCVYVGLYVCMYVGR